MRDSPEHTRVFDLLQTKIQTLHASIWERRADWPLVIRWLEQFSGHDDVVQDQQVQALYLLSNFLYFGTGEIRALLRSLYRDVYRPRLASSIRRGSATKLDNSSLRMLINEEVSLTRFVPLSGNPSESSAFLMYYFRQENTLPKNLFVSGSDLFDLGAGVIKVRDPHVRNYVFLDDLCGSGHQASEYWHDTAAHLSALNPESKLHYFSLFGLSEGIRYVKDEAAFDTAYPVVEVDESFKAFDAKSRIYDGSDDTFDRVIAKAIIEKHGQTLWADFPLGYEDGQLLLGFAHNTPDNTLPVFWSDHTTGCSWVPVFKRYPKVIW